MKVLIVGGGGREHALAWKAAHSSLVKQIYVAPGNAGTAQEWRVKNVNINADDIDGLVNFARSEKIDLTIVGPEKPLMLGIVDQFEKYGLKCFGPKKEAAQLEGSKIFAKQFLTKYGIPTADSKSFTELTAAKKYINSHYKSNHPKPLVIKADGLAGGKGVCIAEDLAQAMAAATEMLSGKKFGPAGQQILIEEFLTGQELSAICILDGGSILPLITSQDHKAAYDGDRGPNTGGMGAYSPVPIIDSVLQDEIMYEIFTPTMAALVAEGIYYRGFLYAGLMVGEDKVPRVLEFNCRLGDPETQPMMMRMRSDLVAHCLAAFDGKLSSVQSQWSVFSALGVVLAARGYPDKPELGAAISGLDAATGMQKIFHSGTILRDRQVLVNGGRVLCATATGRDLVTAYESAYQLAKQISYPGCWYRKDIGHHALNSA